MFKSEDGFYSFENTYRASFPGWHIATREDFIDLHRFCACYVGQDMSYCLKSVDGWDDCYDNAAGIDALGLNEKPLGYIDSDGDLTHEGNVAAFWLGDTGQRLTKDKIYAASNSRIILHFMLARKQE